MPIYEYLCEGCGKVNERLQKVNDPPPARCDECGSRKLAKLVSRSAFQLKGGGWYSDLYGSRKKEAPAGEAPAATATPAATASAAPEATPGAKGKEAAEKAKPAPAPTKAPTGRARKPGSSG